MNARQKQIKRIMIVLELFWLSNPDLNFFQMISLLQLRMTNKTSIGSEYQAIEDGEVQLSLFDYIEKEM